MKLWVINRNTGELRHHGTKGMKWGQRLYQNKDGSLTGLGKLRYGTKTAANAAFKKKAAKQAARKKEREDTRKAKKEVKQWEEIRKKPLKKLTAEELEIRTKRMKKEKELKEVENNVYKKATSAGKQFIEKFAKDAVGESVINVGKTVVTNFLKKRLGLDEEDMTNILDIYEQKGLRGMTDAEISKLGKRAEAVKEANKQFGVKDKEDAANEKKTRERVDKEIEDIIKETEKKNKKNNNSAKEPPLSDDYKVHTGKVSGTGTSKGSQRRKNANSKTSKTSKPDDYYDPIDTTFTDQYGLVPYRKRKW